MKQKVHESIYQKKLENIDYLKGALKKFANGYTDEIEVKSFITQIFGAESTMTRKEFENLMCSSKMNWTFDSESIRNRFNEILVPGVLDKIFIDEWD